MPTATIRYGVTENSASLLVKIRLTQLDGKMPNLALMKLAAYHREQGDEVALTRNARRDFFEPEYDRVYGSVVFRERHRRASARN